MYGYSQQFSLLLERLDSGVDPGARADVFRMLLAVPAPAFSENAEWTRTCPKRARTEMRESALAGDAS
jgi:hypothetical protein